MIENSLLLEDAERELARLAKQAEQEKLWLLFYLYVFQKT